MKAIVKIIKRHHSGCFTVMDSDGKYFMIQLAYLIEEAWQKEQLRARTRTR
jgi:hypothetical protein